MTPRAQPGHQRDHRPRSRDEIGQARVSPAPPPGAGSGPAGEDDAGRLREAARLRREHPGWVVLWLAHLRQFRAYPLVQARHGTALTAATSGDLAAQISHTAQAARKTPPRSNPAATTRRDRPS